MRTLHLGSGTTMKQIIRLGNNRYIHLDTYGEYRETTLSKIVMTTFVIAIAAITAGAMVGIDITNINRTPTQQQSK
jgi:GTPase